MQDVWVKCATFQWKFVCSKQKQNLSRRLFTKTLLWTFLKAPAFRRKSAQETDFVHFLCVARQISTYMKTTVRPIGSLYLPDVTLKDNLENKTKQNKTNKSEKLSSKDIALLCRSCLSRPMETTLTKHLVSNKWEDWNKPLSVRFSE